MHMKCPCIILQMTFFGGTLFLQTVNTYNSLIMEYFKIMLQYGTMLINNKIKVF